MSQLGGEENPPMYLVLPQLGLKSSQHFRAPKIYANHTKEIKIAGSYICLNLQQKPYLLSLGASKIKGRRAQMAYTFSTQSNQEDEQLNYLFSKPDPHGNFRPGISVRQRGMLLGE